VAVGARFDSPQRPIDGGGFVFGVFSSYGTGGVRGTHQGGLLPVGGSRAGCATARFKPQPSATVGERSKGWLTIRLGQMGATQNVEQRRRVDGA
jgi:hypothetical protein